MGGRSSGGAGGLYRSGSRNESMALVQQLLRLTQASGGRGTGTEQNKPLSRQLEQEARKERVFQKGRKTGKRVGIVTRQPHSSSRDHPL